MENPNKRFLSKLWRLGWEWVAAGEGDGRGEVEGKEMVSPPKWGCAQHSQLSNCMMHVCTSMGKFFRSMGQARVSVILRREESTGNARQWALLRLSPEELGEGLTIHHPPACALTLESLRNAECLGLWHHCSRACCRWHCIALQCCLRLWLTKFPHQTLLLLLFSCLASGSQQDGLAESPSPLSGTPRCISRDWHCKSLNRTFLCHKKTPKISLIKIICLCGGKERLQWESQYELLYLPKVLQSPWDLYFCLHFPLGAACIFCVILPCCSVPWSMLEVFGWFNKLILNDLLQIVRLELFGLIMLKMLFPEVFRFFGFLPWCRNSRITQETEIEFFYHQTYKKLIRRERYFNLKSYVVRNSQLEFRGMLGQKMWQSPPSCKCLA